MGTSSTLQQTVDRGGGSYNEGFDVWESAMCSTRVFAKWRAFSGYGGCAMGSNKGMKEKIT